jgi:hypothetical protein
MFRGWNVGEFIVGQLAGQVQSNIADIHFEGINIEDIQNKNAKKIGWTYHSDLWIAPKDERITMVPGVTPAPADRLAKTMKEASS